MKGGINANIKFLTAAITLLGEKKPYAGEAMIKEVHSMLQELKQLHSLLDTSDSETTSIEGLLKSLLSRKPKLESLLNQCIVPKGSSEEKVDALSGELEKMEMTSASTESGSSNQGAKKTQQKGKGNSKNSKKGKKK
ncbi:uncharacterized protein LOC107782866 [Nicotiana tabacum]|uniref:Uncharacterized protein LOC107782866 n=1 Tax=Nicotiana tabacum TaxID=4097 RepID=A0A1S3Z4A7_TOBAC|nr:PREDICTED: uncharacterized protein LOC107782866 [Nicotiana tabacum]